MFNGAHLHLLVNHVPQLAAFFGALLVAGGLLWKRADVVRAALVLFVIAGAGAAAAFYTGEPAEHVAEEAPGVSHTTLHRHEEAAEWAWIAEAALGLLALGALVRYRRREPAPAVGSAFLVAGLGIAAWMVYVSHLGGHIRHPEIRDRAAVAADSLADAERRARRLRERALAPGSAAPADTTAADTVAAPDTAAAPSVAPR